MAHHLQSPTSPTHPGDDGYAQALVKDLESAPLGGSPPGPVWSWLCACVSLGAFPILLWHDRFRETVDEERRQLRRFADWMRLHTGRPEALELRVAADDLTTRPLLSTLSILSVLGLVLFFATQVGRGTILQDIASHTYKFQGHSTEPWELPLSRGQQLFAAWSVALSVAYLFHWLQVQAHASDVRRFMHKANRLLKSGGSMGVAVPRIGSGLGTFWLIAGVFLASKGAWWGLAFALTGAAQQRYIATASPRLRKALAARLLELARRPTSPAVSGMTSVRRCSHERCLAPMPGSARFCPRCGHHVETHADSV